ncbi:MAG: diguanylate cyclase [Gammaproteobacteria bacterium]
MTDTAAAATERRQRRLPPAVAIALAIVIAFAGIAAWNDHAMRAALAEAESGRLWLQRQGELADALWRIETAERGFLLTRNPFFAERARAAAARARELAAELDAMPGRAAAESGAASDFARLVRERLALAADPRPQAGPQAQTVQRLERADDLMERIRIAGYRERAQEGARLQAQAARIGRAQKAIVAVLAASTVLGVAVLAAAAAGLARERRRRERLNRQLGAIRDDAQGHQRQADAFARFGQALRACRSLAEIVRIAELHVALLIPGTRGLIYLMNRSRSGLDLLCSWGWDDGRPPAVIEPHSCSGLRLGRLYEVSRRRPDVRCGHLVGAVSGCTLCVPLFAQSDTVGLLTLRVPEAADAAGDDARRDLVAGIATELSAVIATLTLREELVAQSIRDPLTDVYNRRYLEETMERELLRAQRDQGAFAVIMIDIDFFKRYNDTHGHQAGDLLLKSFARLLKNSVRGEDIACRYGGEEFTLVLPGATPDIAAARAERVRIASRALQVQFQGTTLPPISVSCGVAGFPAHGDTWQEVLAKADAALYDAKTQGRNRVIVAPLSVPAHAAQTVRG